MAGMETQQSWVCWKKKEFIQILLRIIDPLCDLLITAELLCSPESTNSSMCNCSSADRIPSPQKYICTEHNANVNLKDCLATTICFLLSL